MQFAIVTEYDPRTQTGTMRQDGVSLLVSFRLQDRGMFEPDRRESDSLWFRRSSVKKVRIPVPGDRIVYDESFRHRGKGAQAMNWGFREDYDRAKKRSIVFS